MSNVRKTISIPRPIYEKIQNYRASYLAEKKEDLDFSSAISHFAEEGMKAKGVWKK